MNNIIARLIIYILAFLAILLKSKSPPPPSLKFIFLAFFSSYWFCYVVLFASGTALLVMMYAN